MAVTACAGTEGDLLRSTPDATSLDASSLDVSSLDASTPDGPSPDATATDASSDARPGDAATPRPKPEPLSTWQIQLTDPLDTTIDVRVYIADLETPASVIRALHGAGRIVICYFSAGTMEPFRDDAPRFPADSLGSPLADYPRERWVDVRNATVRSIMQERIAKAARVGCDGVHPSGLTAFLANTGFDFTRADQLAYDRSLTTAAHASGLSIGLVNGDASLSQELVADFDWTVVWSCLATNCAPAAPFVAARKAAFLIEYGDENRVPEVCPKAKALALSAIIKRNANLDAFRVGCP
jgi:Glycoside-hydrolase family GH114